MYPQQQQQNFNQIRNHHYNGNQQHGNQKRNNSHSHGSHSSHPPPNPYHGGNNGFAGYGNNGYHHKFNMNNHQQQQHYGQVPPNIGYGQGGAPPQVGYGLDDDLDNMYNQNPDSEDSSQGKDINNGNNNKKGDNNSNNNDEQEVNIGSYQSHPQIKISNGDNMADLPDIPQMPQVKDVNLKPQEDELHRHVGFVIKLNARLVELNAECRTLYPKLAKDLVESKIKEFASDEYKQLRDNNVQLQERCSLYEQQVQTLLSEQDLKNDLKAEIEKLRLLVKQYSSSKNNENDKYKQKDYREMISRESKQYVSELQKQLDIYRDKVIYLSQQSQSCMATIKKCVQKQKLTQEDISNANNELDPLRQHLQWLEDQSNEEQLQLNHQQQRLKQEIDQLKSNAKESKLNYEQLQIKNTQLNEEILILRDKNKLEQSERMAKDEQLQIHMEHKYKSQIQALEERLSKMTVARITMEDDFAQRQKQEQERADKYRAKYESVKQHVKTLEMQKVEYTRVNMQLRQQNNQFRGMITQLQNQLKMITMQQQQQPPQQQPLQQDDRVKQELLRLQEQQRNLIQQQNMLVAQKQEQNKQNNVNNNPLLNGMNNGGGGMNNYGLNNGMNQNGFNDVPPIKEHQASHSYAMGMNGNGNMDQNNGHNHSQSYAHGVGQNNNGGSNSNLHMQNMNNYGMNGMNPNPQLAMDNLQKQGSGSLHQQQVAAQRELWGKRTKVISEKGTKKRILVEWHFVTSDNQPHTVVLQHTQDTKPKTRRMLWVDGSEKYNNKSSASSFRIEIDKDVVVVSIDQLDQYQYRLTINNASYQDAFNLWEQKQKINNQ